MSEIASAWVSLLPSAQGFGAATSKAISPQMGAAGKSAGGILGKAIGLAAAGAILAGGLAKGLYEIGQTFDDMSDTIVVGTGASGKALEGLENVAKNIGKTTPSSFANIGTAVAGLNQRLDLTGKPLQTVATKVLNLSRITGTDLNGNIADLSRVFGDWGISMNDQPAALDKIFYASQKTGTSINSLAQSVVQMGAPLRQFGFSFEESLAMFGKWEKEGVNTTAVMSGLKIGLGKFSKAGEDPKKALADVTAAIKGAGSAGEANKLAIEAFGQRAGPDMAAAVREGRFELGSLVKGIQGSGGAISKADKGTRDFAETWQVFKNNVLLKLEPIATRVFSGFSDFAADNLPKLISGFDMVSAAVNSFIADFKAGIGIGGQFASAFSGVSTVLLALGNFMLNNKATVGAFVGVILTVVAAVKAWTIAQALLNVVLTANPIGLIVVAIAALVAGVVYAYTHFETFRKIVDATFGFLKTVVTTVVAFVGDHWKLLLVLIGGPLAAVALLVVKHWTAIKGFVTSAVSTVINFVRDHWRTIITIIGGPLGLAVALVTKYWSQIKAATVAVWSVVKTVISTQINAAKAVVSVGIAAIRGYFNLIGAIVGKVQGWFSDIVSVIREKLGNAVTFVKGIPGKFTAALSGLYDIGVHAAEQLMSGLADTIRKKVADVANAAKSVAQSIKDHFPGSPVKTGPLTSWNNGGAGKRLVQMLVDGLVAGTPGAVGAAVGMATSIEKSVLDSLTSLRDKSAGIVGDLKSQFDSLASSVSSAFTGDLFSGENRFDLLSTLSNKATDLLQLKRAFKTLRGWGLDPSFLAQLFASGNTPLILDLASGSKGTARNAADLFGGIQSLGGQLGTSVAQANLGPELRRQTRELEQIKAAINRLPDKFGEKINNAVKHGQQKAA